MEPKDKTFIPTEQWMYEKYHEMNDKLFGGRLGECDFAIFTTGRGSQGGVLGWFKITGRNIKIEVYSRRLYQSSSVLFSTDKRYINKGNFVELCRPRIELNGNYSGTEHGFLATLVHEMCHYYTYMNGYAPKQGHGVEFREIGSIVSSRSNGMFTIQRIASAEQMSELELNDEMKTKRDKRLANKKANMTALVVFKKDGQVRLRLTTSEELIYDIASFEERSKDTVMIKRSNDTNLISLLVDNGYRTAMRSYRYWDISSEKHLVDAILKADGKELYENPDIDTNIPNTQRLSIPRPKIVFSIKASNGMFEVSCSSFDELRAKLHQRFPNMSDETIEKLINNKANFKKLEENYMRTSQIINEVIEEFMRNEFKGANNNDSVDIDPNMNLGLKSPLEDAMG